VGDLERTILALAGAGLDPRRFAGNDLVAELQKRRDGDASVDGQVNLTAFYALAIRAAGADPGSLKRSARWLRRAQNSDGGWGIQPAAPSEADSTGAALQGLVAAAAGAGGGGSATADGAGWMRKAQRSSGGYALGGSGVVNSQSTAWAVQGLAATGAGGDAIGAALGYLARVQAADGHYRYSASSDQTPIWVTAQTLLAIERQPFPVPAVSRTAAASGSAADSGSGSASATASGEPSAGSGQGSAPEAASRSGAAGPGGNGGGGAGGSGESGEPAAGEAAAGAPNEGPAAGAAAAGAADAAAADAPAPVPVSVAYQPSAEDDRTTAYLLGGLAVLAAVLLGGLLWYRRRLP
jgi:hypothetical protein